MAELMNYRKLLYYLLATACLVVLVALFTLIGG